MKLLKLSEDGVAHWLVGALVVALIATIGVKIAISGSHAATPAGTTASQAKNYSQDMVFVSKDQLYISKDSGSATSVTKGVSGYYGSGVSRSDGQPATFGENGAIIFYIGIIPSGTDPGYKAIYSISPNGQNNTMIASIPNSSVYQFNSLAWSEPANKLAISEVSLNHPDLLYTMNPDGSDLTQISLPNSTIAEIFGAPVWSPDGTKIAFDGTGGGTVMNADGTNSLVLSNCVAYVYSWTPNGNSLLCGDGGSINTVNIDNTNPQTLISPPSGTNVYPAALSPNGQYILYSTTTWSGSTGATPNCGIYIYTISSQNTQTIDNIPGTYCPAVSWAPNSQDFTFSTDGFTSVKNKPKVNTWNDQVWTDYISGAYLHKVYQEVNKGAIIYGPVWNVH